MDGDRPDLPRGDAVMEFEQYKRSRDLLVRAFRGSVLRRAEQMFFELPGTPIVGCRIIMSESPEHFTHAYFTMILPPDRWFGEVQFRVQRITTRVIPQTYWYVRNVEHVWQPTFERVTEGRRHGWFIPLGK